MENKDKMYDEIKKRLTNISLPSDVKELQNQYVKLVSENLKLRAQVKMLKERVISLEFMMENLRDEMEGLLKSKVNISQLAKERLLYYKEAYGTIINAAKHISSRSFFFTKWMFYTVLVVSLIGFFAYRPDILNQLIYVFSTNYVLDFILIIIIGLLFYFSFFRRR